MAALSPFTTRAMNAYELQLGQYPTPINISYAWSFGSLSGIAIFLQVASGICLNSVYVAQVDHVTDVLESINRDAYYGWLMRSMHANGPSIIFLWLYCHQARSLLIGTRAVYAWVSGWILLLLIIIVAFLGYSCVWGQMSYWAATVITSLVTVLPYGQDLLVMLWGAPVIGQQTLTRFMDFHYLLALAVMAVIVIHLVAVHYTGSSQPLLTQPVDKVPFMQYYVLKDAIGVALGTLISFVLMLMLPTATMDTELYINVNTMSTPEHIVPEWYLLPYYAILRCIPSKTMGCVITLGVLLMHLFVVVRESNLSVEEGEYQ